MKRPRLIGAALGLITLFAAAVRFGNLHFGMPYLSNFFIRPDETLIIMPALRYAETGGNPLMAVYPSLMMSFCAALFRIYYFLAHPSGGPGLIIHFSRSPEAYFLMARSLSALASAATVFLAYALARGLFREPDRPKGESAGPALLAALFLASSALAARDAHFGVSDSLMTFYTLAAVVMMVKFLDEPAPRREDLLVTGMGLYLALAVSTKYSAILMAPLIVGAVAWKGWKRKTGRLFFQLSAVTVLPALLFLLGNPFLWPRLIGSNPLASARETAGSARWLFRAIYRARADVSWTPWHGLMNLWRPLRFGAGDMIGAFLFVIGSVSLLFGRESDRVKKLFLAGVAAAFAGPLFLAQVVPYRYALVLLPLQAVINVAGLRSLWRKWPGFAARAVLAFVAVASLTLGGARTLRLVERLGRSDTRTLAGAWIMKNVPPSMPVVFAGGVECEPQVVESPRSLRRRIRYFHAVHGPKTGEIIAQPQRLQLRDKARSRRRGWNIWRNPDRRLLEGKDFCLVKPSYPLAMAESKIGYPSAATREVTLAARFKALAPGPRYALDATDAFFLPFDNLRSVQRPGPNIEVFWVQGKAP